MIELKESLIKDYRFSESDWEETNKRFVSDFLPAKAYFLEKGKISDKIGIVKSGYLRSFFYDDNANDITTQFFQPGNVIVSMKSFNLQVPSNEYVVALEDAELFTLSYNDIQELFEKIPAWRNLIKEVDGFKYIKLMNRSIQLQTMSAKERYLLFCEKNPELIKRVALKHIASYLGIDIATLSRIRKNN